MFTNEKLKFIDYASRIRLSVCSKLYINWKIDNGVIICRHDVIAHFFHVFAFLLSSLVSDPSFMPLSLSVLKLWKLVFIRALTRNPETGNTPSEFCPISGKSGINISSEKVLYAAKRQVYSFHGSNKLKKNLQG